MICKKGGIKEPVGGIQFYPKEVQERVLELGMITKEQLKKQQFISVVLLVFLDVVILFLMIVFVSQQPRSKLRGIKRDAQQSCGVLTQNYNKAESYWDFAWQWYVLFVGQELFDWFVVDVFWVTMTSWWIMLPD